MDLRYVSDLEISMGRVEYSTGPEMLNGDRQAKIGALAGLLQLRFLA